jgi:integrase
MVVRIRGVKKTRSAAGQVYYYDRMTKTRIRAKPNTPEFAVEVVEARKRALAGSPQTGTFGALVAAYRASPEFQRLAERTRSDYQSVLDWLRGIDGMPIVQLDGPALLAIRDRAFGQRKRRFANHVVQVLGTILNWGRPRKLSLGNPLMGIRNVKIPRPRDLPRANRPWTEGETAAVLQAASGGLRFALALACYAGMRGGDIVRSPGASTTARHWSGIRARPVTLSGYPHCLSCGLC